MFLAPAVAMMAAALVASYHSGAGGGAAGADALSLPPPCTSRATARAGGRVAYGRSAAALVALRSRRPDYFGGGASPFSSSENYGRFRKDDGDRNPFGGRGGPRDDDYGNRRRRGDDDGRKEDDGNDDDVPYRLARDMAARRGMDVRDRQSSRTLDPPLSSFNAGYGYDGDVRAGPSAPSSPLGSGEAKLSSNGRRGSDGDDGGRWGRDSSSARNGSSRGGAPWSGQQQQQQQLYQQQQQQQSRQQASAERGGVDAGYRHPAPPSPPPEEPQRLSNTFRRTDYRRDGGGAPGAERRPIEPTMTRPRVDDRMMGDRGRSIVDETRDHIRRMEAMQRRQELRGELRWQQQRQHDLAGRNALSEIASEERAAERVGKSPPPNAGRPPPMMQPPLQQPPQPLMRPPLYTSRAKVALSGEPIRIQQRPMMPPPPMARQAPPPSALRRPRPPREPAVQEPMIQPPGPVQPLPLDLNLGRRAYQSMGPTRPMSAPLSKLASPGKDASPPPPLDQGVYPSANGMYQQQQRRQPNQVPHKRRRAGDDWQPPHEPPAPAYQWEQRQVPMPEQRQQAPPAGYRPTFSVPLSKLAIQPNIEPLDRITSSGGRGGGALPREATPGFTQLDASEFRRPYQEGRAARRADSSASMGGTVVGDFSQRSRTGLDDGYSQHGQRQQQPFSPPVEGSRQTSNSFKPLPFQRMAQSDFRQPYQAAREEPPSVAGRPRGRDRGPASLSSRLEGGDPAQFDGPPSFGKPAPFSYDDAEFLSPFTVPPMMMMMPPPPSDRSRPPSSSAREEDGVRRPKDPFVERDKKRRRQETLDSTRQSPQPSPSVRIPKDPFAEREKQRQQEEEQERQEQRQRPIGRQAANPSDDEVNIPKGTFVSSTRQSPQSSSSVRIPKDPHAERQKQRQQQQEQEWREQRQRPMGREVAKPSKDEMQMPNDTFVERQRRHKERMVKVQSQFAESFDDPICGREGERSAAGAVRRDPFLEMQGRGGGRGGISDLRSSSQPQQINTPKDPFEGRERPGQQNWEQQQRQSLGSTSFGSTSFGESMTSEEYSSYFDGPQREGYIDM